MIRVEEVVIDAVRVGGAFGCDSSRGSYRRSSSRGGAFRRDLSRRCFWT